MLSAERDGLWEPPRGLPWGRKREEVLLSIFTRPFPEQLGCSRSCSLKDSEAGRHLKATGKRYSGVFPTCVLKQALV